MGAFYRSIDTIRWGRKTCDITLEFEEKGFVKSPFDTRVKNYVFTRTRRHPQRLWGSSSSTNRSKPSQGACGQKKGKDISIMVGAGIIASFLDEGEIDEFIISVIPVMIGEGIPLIAPGPSYLAPPQADRRYEVHGRRGQAPLLGP